MVAPGPECCAEVVAMSLSILFRHGAIGVPRNGFVAEVDSTTRMRGDEARREGLWNAAMSERSAGVRRRGNSSVQTPAEAVISVPALAGGSEVVSRGSFAGCRNGA